MYFADEPEHITQLRDTLQKFAAVEMPREKLRAWDRQNTFDRGVFDRLAKLGVCGLTIDEEFGGAGRDLVAAIAVIDELAASQPRSPDPSSIAPSTAGSTSPRTARRRRSGSSCHSSRAARSSSPTGSASPTSAATWRASPPRRV
jgi:alkylation response protein AidB-like acyl-CoA dehydrogenase